MPFAYLTNIDLIGDTLFFQPNYYENKILKHEKNFDLNYIFKHLNIININRN